jgi:inosine-uridine nucleoside N-ribohydrolase
MTRPIVLDTDMASDVDDALCLALALAAPELDVVAVTCVGREPRRRAEVTRKLLALAGRDDVPVFAGCRAPLLDGDGFNWFGHEGDGILAPDEEFALPAEHAASALARLLSERDDLEVVAIGPLTNLAVALALEPDLAGRVRRLTLMGGHVRRAAYGGHEFAPGVDYNLCADPEASWRVLRAGMPVRLVTAEVTLQTWLGDAEVERLAARGTPLCAALARAVRIWTPVQKRLFSREGCDVRDGNAAFLHDPLALACAYDESFCRFEDLEIEPAIEAGIFRTLERAVPVDGSFPMRCATAVDVKAFREHFMERVLAGPGR